MNQHTKPSISQQADELEEHMMHELERVVSKSTLHYLADGEVKMDSSAGLWAKHPGAIFNMGPDPRLPPMPAKPTLVDAPAAERDARAEGRAQREGHPRLPAA